MSLRTAHCPLIFVGFLAEARPALAVRNVDQTWCARVAGETGLKYVRARFEKSSPGAWTLAREESDCCWETVIEPQQQVPIRKES